MLIDNQYEKHLEHMRNEQEQEHFDHVAGSASEFQNCYSEARSRCAQLAAEASIKINEALALGKFVVVEEGDYHCRATDAVAGSFNVYRFAFDARADADAYVQELYANNSDPEARYSVLPVVPPAPVAPASDDGVPF